MEFAMSEDEEIDEEMVVVEEIIPAFGFTSSNISMN